MACRSIMTAESWCEGILNGAPLLEQQVPTGLPSWMRKERGCRPPALLAISLVCGVSALMLNSTAPFAAACFPYASISKRPSCQNREPLRNHWIRNTCPDTWARDREDVKPGDRLIRERGGKHNS